jgi:hypothetical protein
MRPNIGRLAFFLQHGTSGGLLRASGHWRAAPPLYLLNVAFTSSSVLLPFLSCDEPMMLVAG